MKVLIIDTDLDLVEMLTSWLITQGYEVYRAYTVEQARLECRQHKPDLVLLDPMVKDVSLPSMCRDLRKKHNALIMIMTDNRGIEHEVRCLESGADDYLRKPFFPSQLLARMHALSRRSHSTFAQERSSQLTVGPIQIDSLRNMATIDGKRVQLTPTESKLLYLLAVNSNHICTAHQIVAQIWGFADKGGANLIKPHIWHLRQKIEPNPSNPSYVVTVPRVGYTLIRHSSVSDTASTNEVSRALRVGSL
jgi:DNA-binding response OmpR family regulator